MLPTLRVRLLAGLLLLSGVLPAALPAHAQSQAGPRVLAQPAPTFTFGGPVTFELTAAAPDEVADITLFVRTPDEPRTFVGKARFTRGPQVTAAYTLEPDRRQILPFAPVTYWWELTDGAGRKLATESQTFVYADTRFNWRTRQAGPVTAAWYAGDDTFGQALLDVATEGLTRANQDIKAPLPAAVTVYVYANAEDAAPALAPAGRAWADGHAAPLFGVVAVVLPPDEVDTLTRMARTIPHELTHVLVAQKTGTRFDNVPAWLNEGLAMVNEAAPEPGAAADLAEARAAGRWLSVPALCGPFPADASLAQSAYAESESLVRYLRDRYGSDTLAQLLTAYADGVDCEGGVQRVLGLSLPGLEAQWTAAKLGGAAGAAGSAELGPWLLIGSLVISAPLCMLILMRRPKLGTPML